MSFHGPFFQAPIANLLIVSGILFLIVAVYGEIKGPIELQASDRERIGGGLIGIFLIISGLILGIGGEADPTITPTSSLTPTSTSTSATTPSLTPTPEKSTPEKSPAAQIVNIECADDGDLNVHIRILVDDDEGIKAYSVWSTWGGGTAQDAGREYSLPYPNTVDKVIHLEEEPDSIDRDHQIGLRVEIAGRSEPIFDYKFEPNGRCPNHYQP